MYEEDSLNENPLHKAATNGDEESTRLFLFKMYMDGGVKMPFVKRTLNMQNVLGSTPLHNAGTFISLFSVIIIKLIVVIWEL